MRAYPMLIDGQLVNTVEQDEVINPALAAPFATCSRAGRAHVDEAVAAAARAYRTWRTDEALRRQKLNECAAALQTHAAEVADVFCASRLGASYDGTFGALAGGDLRAIVDRATPVV